MKQILTIAAAALSLGACQQQKALKSGIALENLDTTVQPGADFYQFATGGWQRLHPLTAEYSRYGSFDVLQENNNEQLRGIIEEVASKDNAQGTIEQKIASLYNSAMDSVKLNAEGVAELRKFLRLDQQITAAEWLANELPIMQRQGLPNLFGYYITADEKDAKNNILYVNQGGLTLGQKDYYVDSDSENVRILQAYQAYISNLAQHAGLSAEAAAQMATDVMRIETSIAQASKSMTELRDPEGNYNKLSYAQLKEQFAGIQWDAYFANLGIADIQHVILGQPNAIHAVEKILATEPAEALRNYYQWRALDMAANYVDDESRALSFQFYGTVMSGKQEDRPRWKRAVASVEDALGEALGQLYVAKYFPPAAKARMEQLVKNLQLALADRIKEQDWMSDSTKHVAKEKLDAFYVKVGYPEKWQDYSTLEIGDSYLQNILACNAWAMQEDIKKHLNKPVDRDEWYMTPQTVNAYYNPTTNEICFPAGILQPPFFDMEADDAFNYGAIGVVIGHEMTHGFDDQGSQYDKEGNLRQWWSAEDRARFEERIQVMREFHDKIEVLPGLKANGSLTLGENMADHGGLMVAFHAFQVENARKPLAVIDGFTPEQRFYLAYANVWGQNIRDEEIRRRQKSDPHALGKWRVNAQLAHQDGWYEAFGITEQDSMFVPKAQRVNIW